MNAKLALITLFRSLLAAGHTTWEAGALATYETDQAGGCQATLAWWNCDVDWRNHA